MALDLHSVAVYMRPACQVAGRRSQGGVQFPTGGVCAKEHQPASARLFARRGQQTRLDSEADGIVRMEENKVTV